MNRRNDGVTIYSDYVCPFCYLGRRSLDIYRETRDEALDVTWHPFDLRSRKRGPDGVIDHSVDDGKDEVYFDRVSENVERLKAEYDADEMLRIEDRPEVDSLNAQLASYHVQEEYPTRWLSFDEAIFEALWVDGRDIGDRDVLAELAEGIGLSGEETRMVIDDENLRDRVNERFRTARERGVTGVPTFVSDEHVARGAVPPDHLQRLVEGSSSTPAGLNRRRS